MFDYVILVSALSGIVINIIAYVMISRKPRKSMFHDLLKLLMAFDVFVVICCMLQFALKDLWTGYAANVYPYILPWLLPGMHIAVMSSVYCTILIR